MSVKKVEVIIIGSGDGQDILVMPDNNETRDWTPYMNAIGKFVFDQIVDAGHGGEILVTMSNAFKIEDDK